MFVPIINEYCFVNYYLSLTLNCSDVFAILIDYLNLTWVLFRADIISNIQLESTLTYHPVQWGV